MSQSRRTWGGIVLLILGAGFLLDSVDLIDLADLAGVIWPLALVLLGVKLVVDARSPAGRDEHSSARAASAASGGPGVGAATEGIGGASAQDRLDVSQIFGDFSTRIHSDAFTGGSVSTTFGDTTLDLSAARIAEGEHFLRLSGIFGDTKVILPPGLAVSISARTTLGDLAILDTRREGFSPAVDLQSPGYASAVRRLRIVTSQIFGDVEVR